MKRSTIFPGILKNTNWYRRYWKEGYDDETIDWNVAYFNPDHPHRQLIIDALKQFQFRSVLEVGCGAGANLYNIKKAYPHSDVGGIDWNADAIAEARKMLPKASVLQIGEATDVYISDKGADILLSDMCYIYLDKKNFRKVLKEAKRVARNGVIFCEFHHTNWFLRQFLKWYAGYNAYDYAKELKKLGFYDITIRKVTEKEWPKGEPQKTFCNIISARP